VVTRKGNSDEVRVIGKKFRQRTSVRRSNKRLETGSA